MEAAGFWEQLFAACTELISGATPHATDHFDQSREPLEWLFAQAAERVGFPVRYHSKGKHPDFFTEGPFDIELKGMRRLSGAIQLNSSAPAARRGGRQTLLILVRTREAGKEQIRIDGVAVLHPEIFQSGVFERERSWSITVRGLSGDSWLDARFRAMFMVQRIPQLVEPLTRGQVVLLLPEGVAPDGDLVPVAALLKPEAPAIPRAVYIPLDGTPPRVITAPNPHAGRTQRILVWSRPA